MANKTETGASELIACCVHFQRLTENSQKNGRVQYLGTIAYTPRSRLPHEQKASLTIDDFFIINKCWVLLYTSGLKSVPFSGIFLYP